MRAAIVLLHALLCGVAYGASGAAAYVDDSGSVMVSMDPALLRHAEVQRHLRSGLTTNFVVRLAEGKPLSRVEVRFEPWDEVYYVHIRGADGRSERQTLRSPAALHEWWGSPLVPLGRLTPSPRLRLRVDIVPFSASEEADAKRWLARTADRSAESSAAANQLPGTPSLFSAMVGSSVRRKPVLSHTWSVDVKRRSK